MKNSIIAILLVLVCSLAFYIYYSQNKMGIDPVAEFSSLLSQAKEKVSSGISSVENKIENEIQPESKNITAAFMHLPADTVLAIDLPLQAIKPALDHISSVRKRIFDSSLAKKLKLEEMLSQGLDQGLSSASSKVLDDNFQANSFKKQMSYEEVISLLEKVESLNLLIRSKVVDSRVAPMLNLSLKFKDSEINSLIKTHLDQQVGTINEQAPGTIKTTPQEPDQYSIELKAPISPIELLGSISNKNNEFTLKLATIAGKAEQTSNSHFDFMPLLRTAGLGKESFAAFFHAANLIQLADNLGAYPPLKNKEFEDAISSLKSLLAEYKGAASSAAFKNGFTSRSCTEVTSGSINLATYKESINKRSNSNDRFIKLVSSRTTAAGSIKAGSIVSTLQSIVSQDKESALDKSMDKTNLALERLKTINLNELGILINAPTTSFMPDYAIYIEHNSGLSLQDLVKEANSLIKEIAPESMKQELGQSEAIVASKDQAGLDQVKMMLFGEYPITFRQLDDTTVIGTNQEDFFSELKTALSASENYISKASLDSKNVPISLEANDYQIFLSPASMTAFARQFIPFLTMAVPDLTISDSEVNETFKFFEFNVLITSSSNMPSEHLLCSEGQAVLF